MVRIVIPHTPNDQRQIETFILQTESLRKYPPGNLIRTNVNKEYPIPGTNIVMPKETLVIVPVYAIHHDPDYYTNPEEYNPDRFEPEEVKKRHPQTFMP